MNRSLAMLSAIALGMGGLGAVATAASPAQTIAQRQENFKAIGKVMKGISDQLRTPVPDMAAIRGSTTALVAGMGKVGGHFPKGTGPEAGIKTTALPAIWAKPGEFKAALAKSRTASLQLEKAVRAQNLNQIKAAFPAVGASCKGCHDAFRAKS